MKATETNLKHPVYIVCLYQPKGIFIIVYISKIITININETIKKCDKKILFVFDAIFCGFKIQILFVCTREYQTIVVYSNI